MGMAQLFSGPAAVGSACTPTAVRSLAAGRLGEEGIVTRSREGATVLGGLLVQHKRAWLCCEVWCGGMERSRHSRHATLLNFQD